MGRRTLTGELAQYLSDRQTHRSWSLAAQDGIISTAGILLGFTGAGVSERMLVIGGTAGIVAGMLTAGGAKWSETAAEREAQLSAIREERLELRQHPEEEQEELARYYEEKGLSPDLAAEVARHLMIRSPLKSALESEHGVLRTIAAMDVAIAGVGTSLAFGLGAAIPFAIAYYLPLDIEVWLIIFSVFVALSLISIVGARAGHMDVYRTIRRTLTIGSVTIVVSYLVGQIAF